MDHKENYKHLFREGEPSSDLLELPFMLKII
jgi:hypothetical protein